MKIFKEYEIVKAAKDLPMVPKGSTGTILIVFETNEDYLVEFINEQTGEVFDLLTIKESELQKHKIS
jgi:hypothetical protein